MDSQSITKKKRDANIELLRIVAMLMIITLHFNYRSNALLVLGEPASNVQLFATILEAIAITGVNVYVLISGYYLSSSKVRLSKVLLLILQVYFYTLLISGAMMIVGAYSVKPEDKLDRALRYLFPISSEHYWFVTAYVIMYVLAPVMNAAVNTLKRKQLKTVIIGLLTWFCFIKSIVPVKFGTDRMGYDFGWFICLYLIAAYIRKYNIVLFRDAKKSALVYLISVVVIAAFSLVFYKINFDTGNFNYYAEVPCHYNFFFALTGALGLFSVFRFMRLKENLLAEVIRIIAPYTLGVYLLHMHFEIADRWVEWIEHIIGETPLDNVLMFFIHLVVSVLIVFFAGIFVDWIRKYIFNFFGRVLGDTRLFRFIKRVDDDLC
ncbi:Surface polysaccharide O-acyltransferase, integral membrane enzyme [Butyrivibrio hungatei]|uniref:Surface polysaccharide O-acyltransferase, integral membrane enzyme n=1 Tax=Butyrivibrio hungatei TaxID=185008 RepID=A0A1G5CCD6_9FIRM|nr:acyltransferase [Butyrivibrio hungatei]SCY00159.1 Surface polysaccharide O-acyltransferase, integral membrane enzyme [Butyrivibrio hungatei]